MNDVNVLTIYLDCMIQTCFMTRFDQALTVPCVNKK